MRYGFLFALFKRSHDHLRGFLIAAWAGDKIAEFSFPEISFHFPLRPWFFFVSPAYAGKSAILWLSTPASWDHPRVCGEKKVWYGVEDIASGSPPRMRGKAVWPVLQPLPAGITPAYAGKRCKAPLGSLYTRDHPRVCGEKPVLFSVLRVDAGITPAYAGKS